VGPWVRRNLHIRPANEWERGGVSADASADAPSADQAYFAVAERFLDTQISTNDIFDTKATTTLGVGSTVLPLTLGLLALSQRTVPTVTVWLLAFSLMAYVMLLVLVIKALHIRGFEYRPKLETAAQYSQQVDGATLRRWIAEEYATSSELNRPVLDRKGRYVGFAYIALFVEGLLISIAAGISLFW
jgi:hypothetical protein